MKYLAIIPSRYASVRFPGKPLAIISGMTMIQRVYLRASSVFEDVYVATDDSRIFDTVSSFGGRVVMTSSNHLNGTSRAHEAMHKIEKLRGEHCKYVINIQGDEPFIESDQLKELITCFDNNSTDIATLVKRIDKIEDVFNSNIPKVVLSNKKEALYFTRSPIPFVRDTDPDIWLSKTTYYKHVGLYGFKRNALEEIALMEPTYLEEAEKLEQLRWLQNGLKIIAEETLFETHPVDTPEDISLLRRKGII